MNDLGKIKYNSRNEHRHKNSESLYAHYSMIDLYDCDIFPNLKLTSPIHLKLQSGQSLYIPKNWWHWVRNTQKTFAINYWFNNKEKKEEPFIFDHSIEYDLNLLNNESVLVWNAKGSKQLNDDVYLTTFKEFYNSGLDHKCLITLCNYSTGEYNSHIKDKILNYIKFPVNKNIICDGCYNYNVWISSGKQDTGLHYDDEDGILTVIDGEKEIILFPPEDTKYLYPYEVKYEWKNLDALNFRYNTYSNFGKIDGTSSGELLYITCNNDKRLMSNISKLYFKYQNSNLIWGFKKNKNEYRWEVYNYTLENKTIITSWDLYSDCYEISDEEHYYFKHDGPDGLPFWGYGKYKKNNIIYDESKIFVVDNYDSFSTNYDDYMERLDYQSIKTKFRKNILEKYKCYQICVHNKKINEIFIQYLGISNDDFVEFLLTNNYPSYVIDFVVDKINLNQYKINNEITIVYDIKTQNILRSGFYGNL